MTRGRFASAGLDFQGAILPNWDCAWPPQFITTGLIYQGLVVIFLKTYEEAMVIDHSNLEDYVDPIIYDAENPAFEPDGPFYLALAQRLGGPVLDLGCGTGRITIPIGQQGIEITGLDIVPLLLERAQHKAPDLAIRWVEADLRTFYLGQRFRLLCATGGAFQMLMTRHDQEAALERIREHLLSDGYFAIDIPVPQPEWMQRVDEEQEWKVYTDETGRMIRMTGTEYYDPLHQVKHENISRRWRSNDGREIRQTARFAYRYIFPQEMEALLYHNGFHVVNCYGDPEFGQATAESQRLYYLCQARG